MGVLEVRGATTGGEAVTHRLRVYIERENFRTLPGGLGGEARDAVEGHGLGVLSMGRCGVCVWFVDG